jgi:hypothetical protein
MVRNSLRPMLQPSRFLAGNFSKMLLLVGVLTCVNCTSKHEGSSDALLEKLSPNGQWVTTETKLKVTNPVVGEIGDTFHATISFRNNRLFSGEPLVIQAKLEHDFQPKTHFIEGFALGELNENDWWEAGHHWRSYPYFNLLDAAVCSNAWEKVTGQKPTRTFKEDSIPGN